MRLSIFQYALMLGVLALPTVAAAQGAPQAGPVQHAAMPAAQGPAGYHPQAMMVNYGEYCPPGHPGHRGMHHQRRNPSSYGYPALGSHPNFGAPHYPKQQAPSVWPYIGPYYPNPQIPPGWEKVSLEWDDGYWYFDFESRKIHKHH